MSGRIELWAHLPSNAHGDLREAPGEIRKLRGRHVPTRRGLIAACRRASALACEYTRSHGNAAAHRIEVRLPNGRVIRQESWQFDEELDWDLCLSLLMIEPLRRNPTWLERESHRRNYRRAENTARRIFA